MITDQLTNTIYFSDKLQAECKGVYEKIKNLKEKGLPIEFFSGSKSMWVRDYMPIQVSPDKFIAFKYFPDYLNDTKEHRETITKNAAEICRNIVGGWAEVEESNIILDGGNVIKCDDAVIMVDKVLRENPQYSSSALLGNWSNCSDVRFILFLGMSMKVFTGIRMAYFGILGIMSFYIPNMMITNI